MPRNGCKSCRSPEDSVWLHTQTRSSIVCQSWPFGNQFPGFFTATVRSAYVSWAQLQTLQIDCV